MGLIAKIELVIVLCNDPPERVINDPVDVGLCNSSTPQNSYAAAHYFLDVFAICVYARGRLQSLGFAVAPILSLP